MPDTIPGANAAPPPKMPWDKRLALAFWRFYERHQSVFLPVVVFIMLTVWLGAVLLKYSALGLLAAGRSASNGSDRLYAFVNLGPRP